MIILLDINQISKIKCKLKSDSEWTILLSVGVNIKKPSETTWTQVTSSHSHNPSCSLLYLLNDSCSCSDNASTLHWYKRWKRQNQKQRNCFFPWHIIKIAVETNTVEQSCLPLCSNGAARPGLQNPRGAQHPVMAACKSGCDVSFISALSYSAVCISDALL